MKLTCLSEGQGFHAPPCQVLHLCGLTLLFDCPLHLSALALFFPPILSSSTSSSSSSGGLIRAVPWYKAVPSLHLWDPSSFDAVLVSSPMGILGLPFLTRNPAFSTSTKIYATDLTVRLGRLMMEELVSMHTEHVRFYGPDEKNWTELDRLQMEQRRVVLGEEKEELSGWMPLYSVDDIKNCIARIQPLRLGEEACFNDTLVIKALSSGLEIGGCNWSIKSPKGRFGYLSSSVFQPVHAMEFDYCSLTGHDVIIYSDFSSLACMDNGEENTNRHALSEEGVDQSLEELSASDEYEEEVDKVRFICSCIVDSVKEGGSVLIPSGRCGVILSLLENICDFLGSLKMKVPIYIISEAAQETLALTNSVPEWLCKKRQEKLFSGESLFRHVELIKEGIVTTYPFLYCSDLLENWKEPCIVISPHWSLRLGSAVQLLCRWHSDPRSLLILEEGMPAELALMPFKPVKIKVLQCSFLSGIQTKKVNSLFRMLQPKLVLFPESLSSQCAIKENDSYKIIYYSKNKITRIPSLKNEFKAYLSTDLAFQLQPRKYTEKNMAAARLKGKLVLRKGVYFLTLPTEPLKMSHKPLLHWGNVNPNNLMQILNEREIDGSIVRNENCDFCVCIKKPEEALIEVKSNEIMICCKDETFSALIYEAVKSVCNGI